MANREPRNPSRDSLELNSNTKGSLSEHQTLALKALEQFRGEKRSLEEVSDELGVDDERLDQVDLEDKGLILTVENGDNDSYTTSINGDDLLANYDLIEQGGGKRLVRNITNTFEDHPRSLESIERIGADKDWSGLVDRLNSKYDSENDRDESYLNGLMSIIREPIRGFMDNLPGLSSTEEFHSENTDDEGVPEDYDDGINEEEFRRDYFDSSGSVNIERVVEDFDVFGDDLEDLNQQINAGDIQISGLRSVKDGFYAVDTDGDPWYVEEDEIPESLDLDGDKVVLSRDSNHRPAYLVKGSVEGVVDSSVESYHEV